MPHSDAASGRSVAYWVNLVDALIEQVADDAFDDSGVTRWHWQLFTVVADGARTMAEIDERLGRAQDAGHSGATYALLDDLRRRGWVTGAEGELHVTVAGHEAYDELRAIVARNRDRIGSGIAARDYEITVGTLEQIARNLGWTPGS